MKLFGLNIKWDNNDQVVIRTVTPSTQPVSKIPKVKIGSLSYSQQFAGGRGVFTSGEYDLSEIGVIEDVESFCRQAFKKKEGLMFKEGVNIKGANKDTVRYYKTRMSQMAQASGIPESVLLKRVARSLIRVSNAFLVKVRDERASGGKVRVTAEGKTLKPVAAYFPAAPETMRADIDQETGKIMKWRQVLPNGRWKDYNAEDVIHFAIDRREGFLFGVPSLIPVMDDIRALRQIEENIELLLYQHLFPLFHYKVGTETAPAGYTEEGVKEVDAVEQQIKYMPSEGSIITPERHEIKAIGAEGRAIRAEGYLEHFKKRVFAGLGVSAVDMGDGSCYDKDTQTLTENGWKFYWEIDHLKEKIATFNPETKLVEFHLPSWKYEDYYSGDIYHITGKHLDIRVTPHHEMWVSPRNNQELCWEKVKIEDLYNGNYYSEFYMMQSSSFEQSENQEDSIIKFIPESKKQGRAREFECRLSTFAHFLGFYISEGCLDLNNASQNRYRISISQNKGETLDEICALLDKAGFSFSTSISKIRKEEVTIKIYSQAIYQWINERIPLYSNHKRIPKEVFNWPILAKQKLFDGLMSGDGTKSKKAESEGRTNLTYYTSSKGLADDVQILAISLGYAARIQEQEESEVLEGHKKMYRVYIHGNCDGPVLRLVNRDMIKKENYSGIIYCYSVENHLFLTRRNGKTTIQGNTMNRSTAQTMSRALVDSVKAIQDDLEAQWDFFVISELLLESTFGERVLEEDQMVHLSFAEIDIQNKMELEKHSIELWKSNGITYDEFRAQLGYEPIPVPDDPEDQDLSKYPEWSLTYWKLIEEPTNLIKAVDEPYSISAQAAASARSTSITNKSMQTAQQEKDKQASQQAEENRKTQVAVAASRPTLTSKNFNQKDNFLSNSFKDLESDTVSRLVNNIESRGVISKSYLLSLGRTWATNTSNKINSVAMAEFIRGFNDQTGNLASEAENLIYVNRNVIKDRLDYRINKLAVDAISLTYRRVDGMAANVKLNEVKSDIIQELHISFDSIRYRVNLIWDTEIRKAYYFGRVIGMRFLNKYAIELQAAIDSCEKCKVLNGKIIPIKFATIDDIPPLHPHSRMTFRVIEE
jgi:hypothetical protein